jgi:hypothetical protein
MTCLAPVWTKGTPVLGPLIKRIECLRHCSLTAWLLYSFESAFGCVSKTCLLQQFELLKHVELSVTVEENLWAGDNQVSEACVFGQEQFTSIIASLDLWQSWNFSLRCSNINPNCIFNCCREPGKWRRLTNMELWELSETRFLAYSSPLTRATLFSNGTVRV